jgi:hypothetical protein
LYCINFEHGETVKCEYTGDVIEIDEDYFKNFEAIFLGTTATSKQRKSFRNENQNEYVRKTVAQEMRLRKVPITETEQFKILFEKYIRNLKENALAPFINNDNFRRAINDFGSQQFNTYDERLKRDILYLIKNLKNKFNYTEESAKQVSLYVIDKKLNEVYMKG